MISNTMRPLKPPSATYDSVSTKSVAGMHVRARIKIGLGSRLYKFSLATTAKKKVIKALIAQGEKLHWKEIKKENTFDGYKVLSIHI
ncbi:hypothetical protein EVAR_62981_1 [Eumeta japonica]|uniref:Uncharacterized protein n=1 Tax=Eumeta variegata TaxID=151549 RepID=A0A4C1Z9D7_EUMVA|nr:hypothetical protein EVAR_62981_1 [Eumeta japonica]